MINAKGQKQASIVCTALAFFALCQILFVISAQAQTKGLLLKVEWKRGLLSLNAERVPLSQILQEVALQTGFKIQGFSDLEEPVTLRFSGLTLSAGLKKILARVNHAIIERPNPQGKAIPTRVLIIGQGTALSSKREAGMGAELTAPRARPSRIPENPIAEPEHVYHYTDAPQLIQDARSPDIDIRRAAIEALPDFLGPGAIPLLQAATEDHNPDIRDISFQKLSQMDSDQALNVLRERLAHPDPEMRIMAIRAMASKGKAYALEAARSALNDSDEMVSGKVKDLIAELEATGEKEVGE